METQSHSQGGPAGGPLNHYSTLREPAETARHGRTLGTGPVYINISLPGKKETRDRERQGQRERQTERERERER